MKFRDPKTGEVFDKLRDAHNHYCENVRGFKCEGCPLSCSQYENDHPNEVALRMGMEIIDDSDGSTTAVDGRPTDKDTNVPGKPLRDWTLGEVQTLCEKRNGDGCCDGCPFANVIGNCTLRVLPEEWDLKEAPRLTEPEIAIMRAVGAKWVSHGDDAKAIRVELWTEKPKKNPAGVFDGAYSVARVNADLFPSVHPGECIAV